MNDINSQIANLETTIVKGLRQRRPNTEEYAQDFFTQYPDIKPQEFYDKLDLNYIPTHTINLTEKTENGFSYEVTWDVVPKIGASQGKLDIENLKNNITTIIYTKIKEYYELGDQAKQMIT